MSKFKKGDFTLVPNKKQRQGLPPKLQVIFMWLCDYSDDNNKSFPSRKTLAKDCGISTRALDDGLNKLVELGMIEKENQVKDGEYTSNLYTVNILSSSGAKDTGGGADISLPRAENSTTPSAKSAQRTQPIYNSNHLTQANEDTQLLNLLNKKTERNFKLLPRGYKKTLELFTLDEISKALDNLVKDEWHKERLHELRKEYLLRATTIDNFVSVGTSEQEKRTKSNIEQLKKLRYADE